MDFCFLLSSERSGSNLVTRLMDGHREVCGPSPTHLLRVMLEQRQRYGDLQQPDRWHQLLDDAASLMDTKLGSWRTSVTADELAAEVPPGSLGGVFRHVYEKEASAWGARIVFVKENHVYRNFAFLEREFPGSTFVFLARDPRDMALSWKRSVDLRGGVIRAAETWQVDQCSALVLSHELARTGRIVGLRYEDLVADPSAQLGRICDLLAIAFEPSMVELDTRPSNRENAEAAAGWANIAKPVTEASVGGHAAGLSVEEVQFVEATCRTEMQFLGYEPVHADRPSLVELREAVLPLERYVKPGYAEQPARTRERHARRAAVLNEINSRPPAGSWP